MTTETNNTAIIDTKTLNPVEVQIQEFQSRMATDETAMNDFQIKGWEVAWKQVQEAYRVARIIILDAGNAEHYKAALKKADLKEASEKANKWLPVTKLLFGNWDKANTCFTPDRSAEKYANYFRYFDQNTIPVQDILDTIYGAEFDGVRYLKAIEKMDREDNASSSKGHSAADKLTAGRNPMAADVLKMPVPALVADTTKYGTLVFERVGDEIVILASEELEQAAFEAKVKKRGAALLAKVNDIGKEIALKLALGQKLAA